MTTRFFLFEINLVKKFLRVWSYLTNLTIAIAVDADTQGGSIVNQMDYMVIVNLTSEINRVFLKYMYSRMFRLTNNIILIIFNLN